LPKCLTYALQYIADMKVGEYEVPRLSLITLAEFYNTSTDYLLGLTDEKEPYKRR